MSTSIIDFLRRSELFAGLTEAQIERIAAISQAVTYDAGGTVIHEGDPSDEMYVISDGMVEVLVSSGQIPDVPGAPQMTTIVRLGQGQFFGEMALVDQGVRSATIRCIEDGTTLHVIPRESFWHLCETDLQIGFVVMRNIAADLSFKLRHRNLQTRLAGATR
jgi:CRP-like cAMP-binding protein